MKVECTHCHEEYELDNRFIGQKVKCPNCGSNMEIVNSNLFPCPDCFAMISKRAEMCPKCGSPLKKSETVRATVTAAEQEEKKTIPEKVEEEKIPAAENKEEIAAAKSGEEISSVVSTDAVIRKTAEEDFHGEKSIANWTPDLKHYLWLIAAGVLTLPLIVGIFILLNVLIELKYTRYELTTRRIIIRKGWIAGYSDYVVLEYAEKAVLSRNLWQRFFKLGNITVRNAPAHGEHEVVIAGVKEPEKVLEKINDALSRNI
jgi:predicted RNA-binding Zn-ribbon protein involved in translation (DUF1610 family)